MDFFYFARRTRDRFFCVNCNPRINVLTYQYLWSYRYIAFRRISETDLVTALPPTKMSLVTVPCKQISAVYRKTRTLAFRINSSSKPDKLLLLSRISLKHNI